MELLKKSIYFFCILIGLIAIYQFSYEKDILIKKNEDIYFWQDNIGKTYITIGDVKKSMYSFKIAEYQEINKTYDIDVFEINDKKIYYDTGISQWLDMPNLYEGLYDFKKNIDKNCYIAFSLNDDISNLYICSANGYIKRGKITNEINNVYMDDGMYVAEYSFDIETDYIIKHCFLVIQIDSFEKYRMIWAL